MADAYLDVVVFAFLCDFTAENDDGSPPPVGGYLNVAPLDMFGSYEGWVAVQCLAPGFDEGFLSGPAAGEMFGTTGLGSSNAEF